MICSYSNAHCDFPRRDHSFNFFSRIRCCIPSRSAHLAFVTFSCFFLPSTGCTAPVVLQFASARGRVCGAHVCQSRARRLPAERGRRGQGALICNWAAIRKNYIRVWRFSASSLSVSKCWGCVRSTNFIHLRVEIKC